MMDAMTLRLALAPCRLQPMADASFSLVVILHESSKSIVYRAREDATGASRVVKVLHPGSQAPDDVVRARRELDLLTLIDAPGVVRPRAIAAVSGGTALILQ